MDLQTLLCTLQPHLHDGVFVFATVPRGGEAQLDWSAVTASVQETEGLSVVVRARSLSHCAPLLVRARAPGCAKGGACCRACAQVPEAEATRLGLQSLFRAAWITLTVNSDLAALGACSHSSPPRAPARMSAQSPVERPPKGLRERSRARSLVRALPARVRRRADGSVRARARGREHQLQRRRGRAARPHLCAAR